MTKTAETLKKELSQLSPQDRADIASFLIHSLDEDIDEDVKEAWDGELTQRLIEINQGIAKGDTLSSVLPTSLPSETSSNMGEKLQAIRQKIVASGEPLLTPEEVEKEKLERRGGYQGN